MRRTAVVAGFLLAAMLTGTAGTVWAHHTNPPTTVSLPGGLGKLVVSVESRHSDNWQSGYCANGNATTHPECYANHMEVAKGSGGDANQPFLKDVIGNNVVNSGTTQGPVSFTGVRSSSAGTPTGDGRWYAGGRVVGAGSASVGAGGGAAGTGGKPFGCVTVFAATEAPLPPLGDEPNDRDTDVQVCGNVL